MKGIKIALLMMSMALLGLSGCAKEQEEKGSAWFADIDHCVYSDSGFFDVSGDYVYYTSADEGIERLICTDPECTHEKSVCSAYFDALIVKPFIYNQQFYLVTDYEQENFGEMFLYQADANGKNRKRVDMISENIQMIVRMYLIDHRLYIIYTNTNETDYTPLDQNMNGVYVYDLEEKRGEILYEDDASVVYVIGAYGDCCYHEVSSLEDHHSDLMVHDMANHTAEIVETGIEEGFYIYGQMLFYIKERDIWCRNLETGEKQKVAQMPEAAEHGHFLIAQGMEEPIMSTWENETTAYYRYDIQKEQLEYLFSSDTILIAAIMGENVYGRIYPQSGGSEPFFVKYENFLQGVREADNLYQGQKAESEEKNA